MNSLNIVLTTDDNYIVPTMVTISSILSAANVNTKFNIYIYYAQGNSVIVAGNKLLVLRQKANTYR